MSITVDTTNLINACHYVEQTVGREMVVSLNRAGLNAIIGGKGLKGAMHLTPKAVKSKIMAVPIGVIVHAVQLRRQRKGDTAKLTKDQWKVLIDKEYRRRWRASGYTAWAGWNNAAKALGGKGIKKGVNSGFPKSEASRGYGAHATIANLVAVIANTAPAIEKIGVPALQEALDNAAQDQIDYAQRKMAGIMKKVSP